MKKLLVCSIALALALCVGIPAGQAQGPDPAQIEDGGIGDLLLFSIYDVRDTSGADEDGVMGRIAWQNYLAIENTSGAWTAFHLRFRAWKKSIEVWDHVILLSPYDVFWMTLERHDDGVHLFSGDTETLYNSALIYSKTRVVNGVTKPQVWNDDFSPELLEMNGFCQDILDADQKQVCLNNEMQAGYIEAIGLWQLEIPDEYCDSLGLATPCTEDTHTLSNIVRDVNKDQLLMPPGTPPGTYINVYDVMDALFFRFLTPADPATRQYVVGTGNPIIDSAWPYYNPIMIEYRPGEITLESAASYDRYGLDCGNVLTGVLFMTDSATGRYQMENFIGISNFRTDMVPHVLKPTVSPVVPNWGLRFYTFAADGWPNAAPVPPTTPITITQNGAWQHRDGYTGGGIYFPAAVAAQYYGYQYFQGIRVFGGGDESTYLWYYVNSNWATAAGPDLRDGNDLNQQNWNTLNVNGLVLEPTNYPDNQYGFTKPLGPIPSIGYFVHYFNDIWSLDDVESAISKTDIWYIHLRTRMAPEGTSNVNTDTDVVLTYPTKHYHWFFADWPLMWQWPSANPNVVTDTKYNRYLDNLDDYRGYFADGYKDVEELRESDQAAGEDFINYNYTGKSIAEWFLDEYDNGQIVVASNIWDMEQNMPFGTPGTPPPPSPWRPDLQGPKVPHEVNLIRAGKISGLDHTGIGLGDANWLLANVAVEGFNAGHWRFSQSVMVNGQRNNGMDEGPYDTNDGSYEMPPIGVVIINNAYAPGADGITRSAMAEWHYKP